MLGSLFWLGKFSGSPKAVEPKQVPKLGHMRQMMRFRGNCNSFYNLDEKPNFKLRLTLLKKVVGTPRNSKDELEKPNSSE